VSPVLAIEYVSETGAEEHDQTPKSGKMWVHERKIHARYYAIWDPMAKTLEVWRLERGRYEPLTVNRRGRFAIPEMQLELGSWFGHFQDEERQWLRWWDAQGLMLPSQEESAEVERQRAEAEHRRAEAAEARGR
jgi:hypothetical protein